MKLSIETQRGQGIQKKLPLVGADDYTKLASGRFICIDKTLFIYKLLTGDEVTLITFPRRWNKTTNLTMTEAFLSNHPDNRLSTQLFLDKGIAKVDNGLFLKEHQGQYPVIFLTMKDLTVDDKSSFISSLTEKIMELFEKHYYLINSEKIDEENKDQIKNYRLGKINKEHLIVSIKFLSRCLEKHWGKKVFILIDEYDAPVNESFNNYMQANDFQEKQNLLEIANSITKFLRKFFGSALKTNSSLEKGLMTGILRVSKNKMLSDLNNLVVYGSLEDRYAEYFGFTEDEVRAAFTESGFNDEIIEKVKLWYNGYAVGNVVRYNPWSVMRCLSMLIENSPFPFQCFWAQTGSIDELIKKLMFGSEEPTKHKITALIAGNNSEVIHGVTISESLVHEDLVRDDPVAKENALFTILLHAGYLTATNIVKTGVNYLCDLSIPNHEVRLNYNEIFSDWLRQQIGHLYSDISRHLLEGDIPQFTNEFRQALVRIFSLRDLNLERDYQMILGTILAGVLQTHIVESNRESGDGYPDFVVIPKQGFGNQGIVIELKRLPRKEKAKDLATRKEQLEALAVDEGLKQIEDRYRNDAFQNFPHVTTVLRLGIACCSKQVVCAYYPVDIDFSKIHQIENDGNPDILFSYGLGNNQEFGQEIQEQEQAEQESVLKKQKVKEDIEEGSNFDEDIHENDDGDEDDLRDDEEEKPTGKRKGSPIQEFGLLGSRSRKDTRHDDSDEKGSHSPSLSYPGSENSDQ